MMIRRSFCYMLLLLVVGFSTPCVAKGTTGNQRSVGLQDLTTRTIVYCNGDSFQSVEDCANLYEAQGYVRITDIPKKTAKYDFLTVDTFPTRRWRNGELTPRW